MHDDPGPDWGNEQLVHFLGEHYESMRDNVPALLPALGEQEDSEDERINETKHDFFRLDMIVKELRRRFPEPDEEN